MHFGVLVAEVVFHAQAQRRAVSHGERLPIHFVGEDCLRMDGIDEIDAFIIVGAVAVGVHAAEHDVFCLRRGLDLLESAKQEISSG